MLGPVLTFVDRDYVIYEGKKLLYFGGIDYHRMSNNPMIIRTLSEAALEYGLSSTGSRTTTGNHPLYLELEKKIAEFFETEAAAVFASGYLSNIILLQAIAQNHNIFFIDQISHSSILDAAKQFDKEIIFYEHLDAQHLKEQLKKHLKAGSKPLIMTDGVFPARGEISPLDEYAEVIQKYDAKILIDDAHALAVIGATGKGSWEERGIGRDVFYQTGTLSKGFGVFGGIIPAENDLIQKIQQNSLAFIGSTGLALPLASAAIQSIAYFLINRHIIGELQNRSLFLKEKFRQIGFDIPKSPAPIVSITYYDKQKNKKLSQLLIANGIYPPFINYPGAPPGGHFRFAITSNHTDEQVNILYETVKSSL
jgi:8-amino-7-oxononanoate synthase